MAGRHVWGVPAALRLAGMVVAMSSPEDSGASDGASGTEALAPGEPTRQAPSRRGNVFPTLFGFGTPRAAAEGRGEPDGPADGLEPGIGDRSIEKER